MFFGLGMAPTWWTKVDEVKVVSDAADRLVVVFGSRVRFTTLPIYSYNSWASPGTLRDPRDFPKHDCLGDLPIFAARRSSIGPSGSEDGAKISSWSLAMLFRDGVDDEDMAASFLSRSHHR